MLRRTRLNAYLARHGVASRRGADELIQQGFVSVNGAVARGPWRQVKSTDIVTVKGKEVAPVKSVYFLFYKPKGVVTTLRDAHAERTIAEYIPRFAKGVVPAGRLDKDSEGLIILTNDGALCNRITHPRYETEKEYLIAVKGTVTVSGLSKGRKGVLSEGELLRFQHARIIKAGTDSLVRVLVREGKKRHLRRLFEKLGYPVTGIKRIRIGEVLLGNMKPGEVKSISKRMMYSLVEVRKERIGHENRISGPRRGHQRVPRIRTLRNKKRRV